MRYHEDLALKILLYLEEPPQLAKYGDVIIEGFSQEEISYHIKKLTERGLVDGQDATSLSGKLEWIATDLTVYGHKYLEENRNKFENNNMPNNPDKRRVFVVHGRNSAIRDAMFSFLRSIDLSPMEWSEARKLTEKPNPYVGEILDAGFNNAQAVLVLFTPDDVAKLLEPFIKDDDEIHEKELTPQPRQNVIFEAGMAMGKFPERTVLVHVGKIRPMSDISGLHIIRLNNGTETRQELAERLRDAKCDVKIENKSGWHTEGIFELAAISEMQIQQTLSKREPKNEPTTDLIEGEVHILKVLSEVDVGNYDYLQNELNTLRPAYIKHYLNTLSDSDYITVTTYSNGYVEYQITPKGLEYLVKNKLL